MGWKAEGRKEVEAWSEDGKVEALREWWEESQSP